MTFYDKIMLIACLQLRANIIPCVRELHFPLEERWTLGSDIFPAFFRVINAPKRPWIRATDLLPKFTENEVYKVWLERTNTPHQVAFKPSVPTMICTCAGRFTCHLCGGKHLSPETHGHQYSHHQTKWRHQSIPSFVLESRTQVLLNQVLFSQLSLLFGNLWFMGKLFLC